MSIGSKIIHLASVDSTNNYAATLISEGKGMHGTVILADEQNAGRGQRGAVWLSKPGENLTMSIILTPDNLSVLNQFVISQVVAVSIHDLLRKFGISSRIKWPNDIYVENRKIAGVLIENQLKGGNISVSIVGIGMNIGQMEFGDLQATSLRRETGEFNQLQEVLFSFLESFNRLWQLYLIKGTNEINSLYHEHLYGKNILTEMKDSEGVFHGIILGVEPNGKLKVQKREEIKMYDLKEISFIFRNEP